MISKILTLFALGALSCAAQSAARPAPKAAEKRAAPKAVKPEAAIREVLDRQQLDWNRGDTEGFLLGYDAKAVFVSDKITKGLDELRVRYQTVYPTRGSMGHLTFSDLDIRMLSADYAYVIGRWRLERAKEDGGDASGMYTLLFKRTPRGWKIVVDHTS
jgi:ketosteroid isomerase-like protein